MSEPLQQGTMTDGNPQLQSQRTTAQKLRAAVDASVNFRKERWTSWKENVDYRVQRPFGGQEQGDQIIDKIAVPEDWARTKQKTAQLMFKVPKIVARPDRPEFKAKAPAVTSLVNKELRRCKANYMVDEVLADVINATALMTSMISVDEYARPTEIADPEWPAEVPDPTWTPLVMDEVSGFEVPNPNPQNIPNPEPQKMLRTMQVIDRRFSWKRFSGGAFLWPVEFTSSNWNDAPWLGYELWMLLAEARKKFPNLPIDVKTTQKPLLLSEDLDNGRLNQSADNYVKLQVVYYRAYLFDEDAFHPDHFRTVVFVDGAQEPLEAPADCPWQKWIDPVPPTPDQPPTPEQPEGVPGNPGSKGHYIGITSYPIRVDTLTYVSDMAVPPSDSAAGRPQVRELIRSRTQMLRQRDQSIPIRWYDTNRLDSTIADALREGAWQDMIPVNGPGERVIGEVARASYPRENFQFQQVLNGDLDRSWSLSNNQISSLNTTDRSATEVNAVQQASMIRLQYEKDRVNRYIAEGAQVLFGLMQMFMDGTDYVEVVGDKGAKELVAMSRDEIAGTQYTFEFVPDTSDFVDLSTKQANALKLFNLLGNSPSVNRQSLEAEIIQLHGYDPAELVVEPKEKGPEPPNISFRFGGEDMLNPMAVALMQKAGYNLTQEEIGAAAMMIQDSIKAMQLAKAQLNPDPSVIGMAMGEAPEPGAGGAPAAPVIAPKAPPKIEPPNDTKMPPIVKRTDNGDRMT